MRSLGLSALLIAVCLALVAPTPSAAQGIRAQIRGKVKDQQGEPLKDVAIEFHYKGEKQGRVTKFKAKTDKHGGYVRVGLITGPYEVTYFKEGYKIYSAATYLSGGAGLDELPDVILEKLPDTSLTTLMSQTPAADIEAARKREQETAELRGVLDKAAAAVEAKDWATAESLLQEILKKAPDQPLVWANLGTVAREKGDLPAAEKAYRRVVELDPTDAGSYIELAVIIDAQGRSEDAFQVLQEVAPRFETDRSFQGALGAIAMNAGHGAEAEAAFKRVEAVDPSNAEIQFHLGSLALNRNDTKEAIAHLEKCVALAPDSARGTLAKDLLSALK